MTKDEWIRYKGHPYQIRELTEASLRVIDAVTNHTTSCFPMMKTTVYGQHRLILFLLITRGV